MTCAQQSTLFHSYNNWQNINDLKHILYAQRFSQSAERGGNENLRLPPFQQDRRTTGINAPVSNWKQDSGQYLVSVADSKDLKIGTWNVERLVHSLDSSDFFFLIFFKVLWYLLSDRDFYRS